MNILFDGNYLYHKTFSVFSTYYKGQNMEDVLSDKEKKQVLLRKCVIDMCYALKRFEGDITRVAFVIDSSSWRYKYYEDYKYALTRVREPFYKQFLEVLGEFEHLLRNRGIIVSRVLGAEGDDLLYIWSIYFSNCLNEKLVIITGDSDIRQIMNKNVSLFNNNSKNLKLYCVPENKEYWEKYLDSDVEVVSTIPFEVLLYKVIIGDTSDNIPKIKRGFGVKSFDKFINWLTSYKHPEDCEFSEMSDWIASKFSEFINCEKSVIENQISFNLKMTWLNLSVYNEISDKINLLEDMLEDVSHQKDKYKYNKKYTLEEFYNLTIK